MAGKASQVRQEEGGYYVWNKGVRERLSQFFFTQEFDCKCSNEDCVEQRVSVELLSRLDWLREASRSPLRVHSGFRCAAHQDALRVGGVSTVVATKKSTHELGQAADVSSSALIPQQLRPLAAQKFKAIGTAPNFLHLDLRDDKVRRWNY